jgi:hypothetical protein
VHRLIAVAVKGVRLHDLRHTFAVLQLSAGVHFMQVSKWLGHATYSLTLDVYGGYIPTEDGGAANNLPEPPARAKSRRRTRWLICLGANRSKASSNNSRREKQQRADESPLLRCGR